jgi:hypothetical protein
LRIIGIICLAAGLAIYIDYGQMYIMKPTLDAARLQVRTSNINLSIGLMIIGSIFTAASFISARLKKQDEDKARQLAARRPCPQCAEAILPAAKVCPHCRHDLRKDWSTEQA